MVTQQHKIYKLSDLSEGNCMMVDSAVNPSKPNFSDDEELGINRDVVHSDNRWTSDAFKQKMHQHKTPAISETHEPFSFI